MGYTEQMSTLRDQDSFPVLQEIHNVLSMFYLFYFPY